MKITSYSILLLAILLMACTKKEPQIVTVELPPQSLSMDSIAADTSKVLMASLPVYFDSTYVLIHHIGFENIREKSTKFKVEYSKSSGGYDEDNYNFRFNKEYDSFSGNIVNLYFENAETGEQRLLTDKALNITSAVYQRALAKKTGRHYLIYQIFDKDYNGDGKLNYNDIPALYVSTLDGKDFTKITSDFHAFVDGRMIMMNERYYFRTYEDVNRNCRFDNKTDKYHYYYIDFSTNLYKVVEYNPFGTIYGNMD